MKKRLILFLLLITCAAHAQRDIDQWLATSQVPVNSTLQANAQLDPFIQSLTQCKGSDQKLLRKTFHRVQASFLKEYEAYSEFEDIFYSGHYDCLTATALFSHVLDQLNFSYDVIETNYHIFLVVKTTGGDVLIESTDKLGGFVTGEEPIAQRIREYGQNNLDANRHSTNYYYQYSFSLCNKISPEKLTGLMYFNQAVKAYNQKDWVKSSLLLEKAYNLYASPRCEELGMILTRTLLDSTLEEQVKASCLSRLRNIWTKNAAPLASN